jgi:hypothetical protein
MVIFALAKRHLPGNDAEVSASSVFRKTLSANNTGTPIARNY